VCSPVASRAEEYINILVVLRSSRSRRRYTTGASLNRPMIASPMHHVTHVGKWKRDGEQFIAVNEPDSDNWRPIAVIELPSEILNSLKVSSLETFNKRNIYRREIGLDAGQSVIDLDGPCKDRANK